MPTIRRSLWTIIAIVLLGVPVTLAGTFALLPLWSTIESRFGIESVGHSGPADWCFWVVFAAWLVIAFVVAGIVRRRRALEG